MDRRELIERSLAGAAGWAFVAGTEAPAVPPRAKHVFSVKYRAWRERFLRGFEFNGQVAAWADGKRRQFSDQTLYMGFALLTFAGEARLLAGAGGDARPSERVIGRLLAAFERLDNDAERRRYGTAVPGFFLRDYVEKIPGLDVSSDFLDSASSAGRADMSLDQGVSLMMGWWAVARWSTDAGNRQRARAQAARVMGYLMDQRFMIDKPGTRTSVGRGNDARGAAGFLCHMAEAITGEGYYHRAKVRLKHDNRCPTCAGTGLVNVPNPNLQCIGCHGTGEVKIVLGGGKCLPCRGSGEVRIVTESDCPGCRGTGEIRVVVTDWLGHDHTLGKGRCSLCHGSGKIGGRTDLGKCKVCRGSGRLPSYTKDLGRCKLCRGSGRLRVKLPKIKCPVCGGSKELNLYATVTHPLVLALEPLAMAACDTPRLGLHQRKVTIDFGNRKLAQSYVRHLNLVCMVFEPAVSDTALLLAAKDSDHPWAMALRAAMRSSVCSACHGQGKLFVLRPEAVRVGGLHTRITYARHELGPCARCGGRGALAAAARPHGALLAVMDQLVRLHRAAPADGPGARSPSIEWARDNRWVRCTDRNRPAGTARYNGLDFLSLEVLIRLAGGGARLPK